MKQILITVITLFSVLDIYAAGTVVTVTPTKPARCDLRDYTLINSIYGLAKEETNKEVTVTFKTSIGSCHKNVIKNFNYTGYQEVLLFKEGLSLPWSYLPNAETILESEDVLKVTLTFDKSKTFKKKASRKMQFTFNPGYFEGAETVITQIFNQYYDENPSLERNLSVFDYMRNLNFLWNINLSYDSDKDVSSFVFDSN